MRRSSRGWVADLSRLVVWDGVRVRHLARDAVGMDVRCSVAGRSIMVVRASITLWLGVTTPLPRGVRCSLVVVGWHSGVASVRHGETGS